MIEVSLSYDNTLSLELKNLKGKGSADYLHKLLQVPNIYYDFSMCKFIIPYDSYSALKDLLGEVLLPNFSEHQLTGEKPQPPKIYDPTIKPLQVPNADYHDYQEFGMQFMIDRINRYGFVLNCDDVGLGKTIQSIGVMLYYIQHRSTKKIVVVCKKPLKIQWLSDIKMFFKDAAKDFMLCMTSYEDDESTSKANSKEGRIDTYEAFTQADKALLICNYENFIYDSEALSQIPMDLIIIDEAHNLSNYETKTNECVRNVIMGKPCVLLTGTPITKSIKDIYGIVGLASDTYFGSYKDFQNKYLGDKDIPWSKEYRNLNEVKEKVKEISIRRTPYDTDADFPDISPNLREATMEPTQKELFLKLAKEVKDLNKRQLELLRKSSRTSDEARELAVTSDRRTSMLYLEQFVASDFNLVAHNENARRHFKEYFETHCFDITEDFPQSPKTKKLLALVHEIVDSNNKVLIFSYYNECVQYIYKCLRESLSDNIDIVAYHGEMSQKEKDNSILSFKNKDRCKVLIGTDAMGEGLNLQAAQYLINYDQPQNNGKKDQRIGRIRRLSSKFNKVIYYDLITVSPDDKYHTRDEQLLSKINGGRAVADYILEDDSNSAQDADIYVGPVKMIPFGTWILEQYVRGNKVTYKLRTNTILTAEQLKEAKEIFAGMGAQFDTVKEQWTFYYNPTNLLHVNVTRKDDVITVDKTVDINTIAKLYSSSYDKEPIWLIRLNEGLDRDDIYKWWTFFKDNDGTKEDYTDDIVFKEDPSSKFNMTAEELPPIPKIYSIKDLMCKYLSVPGKHSMFVEPVNDGFLLIRYNEANCAEDAITNDEEIFDNLGFQKINADMLNGSKCVARLVTKDLLELFSEYTLNVYGTIGNYMRTVLAMPKEHRAIKGDRIKVYVQYDATQLSRSDLQVRISYNTFDGFANHMDFPNRYNDKNATEIRCGNAITIQFFNKRSNQPINPETFLKNYSRVIIRPTLKKNKIVIKCFKNKIVVVCNGCPMVDTIKQ